MLCFLLVMVPFPISKVASIPSSTRRESKNGVGPSTTYVVMVPQRLPIFTGHFNPLVVTLLSPLNPFNSTAGNSHGFGIGRFRL